MLSQRARFFLVHFKNGLNVPPLKDFSELLQPPTLLPKIFPSSYSSVRPIAAWSLFSLSLALSPSPITDGLTVSLLPG